MTAPTPVSTAILTEHFRWTPLSFIDDVINTINELMYQSVSAVEEFMMTQPPSILGFHPPPGTIPDTDSDGNVVLSPNDEMEIQKGVHRLETLCENGVDRCFDGFELYVLRNIFAIEEQLVGWVRLGHHKGVDFSLPPALTLDFTGTNTIPTAFDPEAHTRLRSLRQTLLATHALSHSLQSEKAANARTLAQLRTLVASTSPHPPSGTLSTPFSLLAGAKDKRDAAVFAGAQVSLIRGLVEEVRPKYQTLLNLLREKAAQKDTTGGGEGKEGNAAAAGKQGTPEEERQRYIERMTRRHLESSRGMRLNARGDVVGGDFDLGGVERRRIEEVQALEGIAEVLKRGNVSGSGNGEASS